MPAIITRNYKANFLVSWEEDAETKLMLDFNPLIAELSHRNIVYKSVCFLHFQGKPKNLRRFALYCSSSDEYTVFGDDDQLIINTHGGQILSIDEAYNNTLPTSVICFVNCKLTKPLNSPYYLIPA